MTDTILIESSNLELAVSARNAAVEKFKQANVLLAEAAVLVDQATAAFGGSGTPVLLHTRDHCTSYPLSLKVEKIVSDFDRALWVSTLQNSGLTNIISQKEYNKAIKSLDKEVPEFTGDNVRSSYLDLAGRIDSLEASGLTDLFHDLSWDYRSNLPVKLGKRLVFKDMLDGGYFCHERAHCLNDLEKALCRADGKSPPSGKEVLYEKAHRALHKENKSEYENEYVRMKWFKNGNLHLWPIRTDLFDVLNKTIAAQYPNALPPAR